MTNIRKYIEYMKFFIFNKSSYSNKACMTIGGGAVNIF
jgi:hypothetical protein